MAITTDNFRFVSEFARQNAAIVLEAGKEYLVEQRLAGLARDVADGSLDRLVALLRDEPTTSPLLARTLDALTTNETSFFRDFHPFEALRKTFIPELLARPGAPRLAIWSAACSAGQEPVSLAILLREHFPEIAAHSLSMLATDLSSAVLQVATSGLYTQFEVNRGLPATYLARYFSKDDQRWRVKDSIRSMIDYRSRNLIEKWPTHERFDLVMLRNVLIYFDTPTKQHILREIRARMNPGGLLFLGTAETTLNLDPAWELVRADNTTAFRIRSDLA